MKNILYICAPSSIHDVKWVSFFAAQKEKYGAYVIGEIQNFPDWEQTRQQLSSLNITLLPCLPSFSFSHPFRTVKGFLHLRRVIRDNNIDAAHALFATPHALWCLLLKTPYIITTRGSDILLVIPQLLKTGGYYGGFLFGLFKTIFRKADYITSTSYKQAQKVAEIFGVKASVIRTGVDVDRIVALKQSPAGKEKKFIFSPRFISPIYNTMLQLDAIELLDAGIISNYEFHFVRGKKYDSEYYKLVANRLKDLEHSHGLRYRIFEYMEQEELWRHYGQASLCIMTPLSDGTPNSALEAMAAGCALIIPDIGYDDDLFTNNCLKYQPGNVSQLAGLISQALQNYPSQLKDKAFNDVNTLGNRLTEMKKIMTIYDSL